MARPSFLSLVNDVLVRLREPEVSAVNENIMSKLIGKFVNDAKRQVEDAYDWNALSTQITLTTSANVPSYPLVGSDGRFKVIDIYNNSNKYFLTQKSGVEMTLLYNSTATPQTGIPYYYNFNGTDSNGDTKVDLFPVPNNSTVLLFNLFIPQNELATDAATLLVPKEPVVLLALARALVERGEDGGLTNSEAYGMFKSCLSDYIAIESSRYIEDDVWVGN